MTRFSACSARIFIALLLLGQLACRARVLVGRELPIAAEPVVSADAGPDAARSVGSEEDAKDDGDQMLDDQMLDERMMGENDGEDASND